MATELEKLVITLVADNADLKAKLAESKKVAEKEATGMRAAFSGLAKGVDGAIDSIASLRGLIVGGAVAGMAAYTAKVYESVDGIGKLAQTTGFGTDAIQELTFAASQSNVETSALNQGLTVFSRTVGDAAMGTEAAEKAFRSLNVSVFDGSGKLKSNESLLREVSDALTKVGSDAERAAYAQDLFGRGGQALLPLLSRGAAGLEEFAAQARSLGIVLDRDLIARADETNDKLAVMKKVIDAQVAQALLGLSPIIIKAADNFAFLAEKAGHAYRVMSNTETTEERIKALQKELGKLFGMELFYGAGSRAAEIKAVEAELDRLNKTTIKATETTRIDAQTEAIRRQTAAQKELLEKKAQSLVDNTKPEDRGAQIAKEIETLRMAEAEKLKIKGDTQAAIQAREEALGVYYEEQRAKQIEDLITKNEQLRALDDEKYAADIEANQLAIDSMLAANMVSADQQTALEMKVAENQKKLNKQKMADAQSSLSFISQLQHSKSKEMAAVGKAAAIANTTITTYEAATKAYSALAGIPFIGPALGAAAAAAAIAAGLSNVASIAGVDVGFNKGVDMVPGVGSIDSVRAMLTPGERVVDKGSNRILEQFLEDYQVMRGQDSASSIPAMGGGRVVVELRMTGELAKLIQAELIEMDRLNTSLIAA